MRIRARVKPLARHDRLSASPDGSLDISVKAPPSEGRANKSVLSLVADYFGVPTSRIRIVAGHRSRVKLIEVPDAASDRD